MSAENVLSPLTVVGLSAKRPREAQSNLNVVVTSTPPQLHDRSASEYQRRHHHINSVDVDDTEDLEDIEKGEEEENAALLSRSDTRSMSCADDTVTSSSSSVRQPQVGGSEGGGASAASRNLRQHEGCDSSSSAPTVVATDVVMVTTLVDPNGTAGGGGGASVSSEQQLVVSRGLANGSVGPKAAAAPSTNGGGDWVDLSPLRDYLRPLLAGLSGPQLDQLAQQWVTAGTEDRLLLSKIVPTLFQDATFIQRIHVRVASQKQHVATSTSSSGGGGGGSSSFLGGVDDPSSAAVGSSGGGGHRHAPPLSATRTAALVRKLRRSCDEMVCKMQGPGPFPIRFHVVSTAADVQEAIGMYATQFSYPDPPALKELVVAPRRMSTRTRRKVHGNFTWTLRSLQSSGTTSASATATATGGGADATAAAVVNPLLAGELCTAVTVNIINADSYSFIEMPLFATASGYKKLGLAKVLNAALQEHCIDVRASFILVSADVNATNFWLTPSMGYARCPPQLKQKIAFYYENDCSQFENTELLVWYAPTGLCPNLVAAALSRTKLVVEGPPKLMTL